MMRKLMGSFGAAALLWTAAITGGGCTPADRDFASGGNGGQGGMGGQGCPAGFDECDGNPDTVCETDTTSRVDHCGTCNKACAPALDANIACVAGTCSIASCNNGREDCNKFYDDGCETNPTTSFEHCGTCGNSCEAPDAITACVAGACALAQCVNGKLDCDMDAKTGCEVDPVTNVDHCSACGMACTGDNATIACQNSQCAITACATNFGDCNMNAADGCETDLMFSPDHCGTCGFDCKDGGCRMGTCVEPTLVAKTSFSPGEIFLYSKFTLYIGSRSNGDVARVDVAGGTPTLVGPTSVGAINEMHVGASNIFVSGATGTMRMDLTGMNQFSYGNITSRGIDIDQTNVYFTGTSSVRFAPIAGGTTTILFSGVNSPYGMTLSNGILYWGTADGNIWSSPTTLPMQSKLGGGPSIAANLVVDANSIYWSSSTGIHSLPRSGGMTTDLAPASNTVRELALDDVFVYWTDEAMGLVQRTRKDGKGKPEILAHAQGAPWGIVLDANFVYWANSGTNDIWKVPR